MRHHNTERADAGASRIGSQRYDRLGSSITPLDKLRPLNPQGHTWRWNSLSLDKPLRRWEIPDDILHLATSEVFKPGWWVQTPKCNQSMRLFTGKQRDPGHVLSPEERDACTKPELLEPRECLADRKWWSKHKETCAYWAINDAFWGYVFDSSTPVPPDLVKWKRLTKTYLLPSSSPRDRAPRGFKNLGRGIYKRRVSWAEYRETYPRRPTLRLVWSRPSDCSARITGDALDWRAAL